MIEEKVVAVAPTAGTDDDPRYADRARRPGRTEKFVALCFTVSLAAMVALTVAYWQSWSEILMGSMLGAIFVSMGVGVIAWGKYLMPQGPFVEERHPMESPPDEVEKLSQAFDRGAKTIKRRSFLGKYFLAINGVIGLVLIVPLRSLLGKNEPGHELYTTPWGKGTRMVTLDGTLVNINTTPLVVGGVLTVFPEGYVGSSMGQAILIHASKTDITIPGKPQRDTWAPSGYIAFSKQCTHAGCPVGLYEQQFQQLLCPCHQSVFDVPSGGTQVFGPAPRPLPQLPLYIDSDGYIRSQSGFLEPVGPGFWSRGGTWNGYA